VTPRDRTARPSIAAVGIHNAHAADHESDDALVLPGIAEPRAPRRAAISPSPRIAPPRERAAWIDAPPRAAVPGAPQIGTPSDSPAWIVDYATAALADNLAWSPPS